MHESSLVSDLIRKAETIAHEHHAARVVGVKITLGALVHISPEHLSEHFAIAARGTQSQGARLEVQVSKDTRDFRAQEIVLDSVEVRS